MDKINQVNFFQTKKLEPASMQGLVSIDANDTKVKSFKDTFCDMLSEMNEITQKPQQATQDFMQGKADIHDVMAAMAQSEMTVQVATTITGKILQTYEKISQITI